MRLSSTRFESVGAASVFAAGIFALVRMEGTWETATGALQGSPANWDNVASR
ncbi:hypothetical protein AA0113_g3238 [Alternaria arborescens]|uniref:Uncharacterized protein n=1 Tax=Alternaria arborescens TaxID=156630 RepID=A0A4Q4SI58_9PLEO|nr:hypothetical protein AA0113_g3238 [Alternaria arborescens]